MVCPVQVLYDQHARLAGHGLLQQLEQRPPQAALALGTVKRSFQRLEVAGYRHIEEIVEAEPLREIV